MEKAAQAATGGTQGSPQHRLCAVRHDRAEVIPERLAVVTGGNKGVGLEVCRQLALQGVAVILTARDEKRGKDAAESLRCESELTNIIFHQLDVRDDNSVTSLAWYIESRYGKLDILVNNAGVSGIVADEEGLKALNIDAETWTSGRAANLLKEVFQNTYDEALNCLNTNYYGCKRVTEALLPLLKLSTSGARIVNASSLASELKRMPNEKLRNDLCDINIWDEDRIEAVLNTFLEDLKNGRLEEAGWPMMLPTYSVSKMVINLYTRIMARRYPEMRINCVRPGFVKTDICWNLGLLTPEQGARGPVMLALLPDDGPTGCYFDQTEMVKIW
ncbi:(+)-neomenthol dehydrogenase [Setaria italica]|uniref:(+)-neomenthol dehydrogenase n=2 Tax=Setaria italica TaxID=4555 RepID=K3ZV50_SETIT|nr:(+)-neomenthol dehydrogenase [Setaria italica]XP_014660249.1 (+)-neomenthol dehydrogenase [Setaria italica]XP_014660250.1 (+)-neomenthol dehydrogenase [Setaria italica]XP_014660251.1 (+)-neomenthol dehydrogenase [Setaria italica]